MSLQRNFRISEHSGIMYRAWPANIGSCISENKLVITCCLPKVQKCSIIYHKGLLSSNIPKGCVNSKKVCFGGKTNFCQESRNLEKFMGDIKSQSENFGKLKFFLMSTKYSWWYSRRRLLFTRVPLYMPLHKFVYSNQLYHFILDWRFLHWHVHLFMYFAVFQ